MKILFTGHRDKILSEDQMDTIALVYPEDTWVQGGAIGFDTQVKNYAQAHGIPTETYPPEYSRYGRDAPLIRNREMVDMCKLVIACYDGRGYGGTYYTIRYAQRRGKKVVVINPDSDEPDGVSFAIDAELGEDNHDR